MGLNLNTSIDSESSLNISSVIKEKFFISPILFAVPLTVIFMIYKKVKAVPALFVGIILGSVFALIFQSKLLLEIPIVRVLFNNFDFFEKKIST